MDARTFNAAFRSPIFLSALAGWIILIPVGFGMLVQEAFTPVASADPASSFPADSLIKKDGRKPTLLFFVHPYCPCSRASLHQLEDLLAKTKGRVDATIVFSLPEGMPPGWEKGDLWKIASSITGVRLRPDPLGKETSRFAVTGSGHLLLYDPDGHLIFSGGITPSRGHEGENAGSSALLDVVLKGSAQTDRSPVFGCSLFGRKEK